MKSTKFIEIKLNNTGRQKWKEAKKNALETGESIMFVTGNKVYVEKSFFGYAEERNSTIDLPIEPNEIEAVYKNLLSEKATAGDSL